MATWLEKQRDKAKRDKLSREMTHTGRYDNEAIRKERWEQVKNAPGQYAQGMFTDFVGAPVDIANIALSPLGLGSEKPVMGSRHLADLIGADESALPYQVAQYMPLDAGDIAMSAKLWGPALAAALGGTAIAAKASKGAKLSDLAQAMPKQRGIFAGVGAKTADKKALALAEQLKAKGIPDEQIWKETGWTFGFPDQKPRFEIPDNAAKLTEPVEYGQRWYLNKDYKPKGVFESLQHNDLQAAYPMGTKITAANRVDYESAQYSPKEDLISLPGTLTDDSAKSTTLHELQHAIQQREGFARGGNPDMFVANYEKAKARLPEVEHHVQRYQNAASDEAQWAIKENKPIVDEAMQWAKQQGEWTDMMPLQEKVQQYILDQDRVFKELYKEAADLKYGTAKLSPHDQYKRLAGEAEARLTQARMNMTPEQRLAQYPYQPDYFQKETGVPLKDLIVRKDGGTAMSLPAKTEFELAHEVAQKNAALPVEQGGLGLHPDNTAMDRAKALAGLNMPENIPKNLTKADLKKLVQSDVVQRAHTVGNLQFQSMPIADFNRASTSAPVYKSPSYNGNQSSEYRLGVVNGEPVYMRKSDHFGEFGVNIKEGTQEGDALLQIGNESGDDFGRMGKTAQNWKLIGGKTDQRQSDIDAAYAEYQAIKDRMKKERWQGMFQDSEKAFDKYYALTKTGSEAGYIPLSELQGRIPEKIYGGKSLEGGYGYFGAPMVKLPNGQLRSRFAAFDPMQRNSANLLAGGAAGAIGLSSLADLLNQDEYQ